MKITISFLFVPLALLLSAGSACTPNTANVNAPATNITADANANVEPAATPAAGSAEAVPPEATVADLYKQHDAKKGPFFQTKDRALVDKYFTKQLADLIWKDAISSKGEVGAIDGDPLYNAQDMEIKGFAIGKGEVKDDTASVGVTFTNFGQKTTITYTLKQVNAGWKIDDIKYGNGDSLMKWLKDTYSTKPETTSTEFEGKYQVGDTFCTVRPVKMAFEVSWAKGSGVETFLAEGNNTFSSNPDKGEPNSFVFDDDKYNSGKFLRGDGKTFPVKRLK